MDLKEKQFPKLPDPWADGEAHNELFWPVRWNYPHREEWMCHLRPAKRDEIGDDDHLRLDVPGARPLYLSATLVRTLLDYMTEWMHSK